MFRVTVVAASWACSWNASGQLRICTEEGVQRPGDTKFVFNITSDGRRSSDFFATDCGREYDEHVQLQTTNHTKDILDLSKCACLCVRGTKH